MDKFVPDYSTYSFEELQGVSDNIDREKYPERFRLVEKLISERYGDKEVHSEEVSFQEKVYFGTLTGEVIILIVTCIFAVFGYSLF